VSRSLRKLKGIWKDPLDPVEYYLPIDNQEIYLNPYLGKTFSLQWTGEIRCIYCERFIKKSYHQGYCFPCFQTLARCDFCILKPETCHFHLGTCREPEWGKEHCFMPHWVYLANTSGLKVGITRETQIPTRWIDQGATEALPICRVESRYQSGLIEIQLKKWVNDKTDWRKMLSSAGEKRDLRKDRDWLLRECNLDKISAEKEIISIKYPVLEYPKKVKAINIEKTSFVEGTLLGIKGQYLIFDVGVLNIRKLGGYHVSF